MDIPSYLRNDSKDSNPVLENYNEELNANLRYYLSNNGYPLPQITNADLTVTPVQDPNTLAPTTIAALMPDGTVWYVTDAAPPTLVIKINGGLQKFTTTAYP